MFELIIICILAILGLLTASNAVIDKLPSAETVINKLRPFEEIIGSVSFGLGVFKLAVWVLSFTILFKSPIYSIFSLLTYLVLIGLGAYLARDTITKTLPFTKNLVKRMVEFVTDHRRTIGLAALAIAAIRLFFWIS
jgi:hypothetical protein